MSDYTGATRVTGQSASGATQTVTSTTGKAYRLRMVTVVFNGGTAAGTVVTTLVSGAGAAYNVALNSTAVAGTTPTAVWIPSTPIPVNSDDQISVAVPAITAQVSSCAIYLDRLAG